MPTTAIAAAMPSMVHAEGVAAGYGPRRDAEDDEHQARQHRHDDPDEPDDDEHGRQDDS